MKIIYFLLFTLVSITFAGKVNAALLSLISSDPTMDQFGPAPDLQGMTFDFDNLTGSYVLVLQTTSSNPFIGSFRININLLNLDVGTFARDPSLFQDTFNDFSLSTPTTVMTLTGTNTRLLAWNAGDRILLNNFPDGTPHPDGSSHFRSGVNGFPLISLFTNEDMLGIESQIDILSAANAPPSAVPTPSALLFIGTGFVVLIRLAKNKKLE